MPSGSRFATSLRLPRSVRTPSVRALQLLHLLPLKRDAAHDLGFSGIDQHHGWTNQPATPG